MASSKTTNGTIILPNATSLTISETETTPNKNKDDKTDLEVAAATFNDCEELEGEYVVVPPDGGWGWMIVFGSFMCNLIVDGITFSFSAILEKIEEELKVSKSDVTLVGSLLGGCYLIVGPFASALANRYGFRVVAATGTIIGTFAFVLSYFAKTVQILWLTYGVIGGIGFGLIYVPAVLTVGFYFEKWRAMATGIGVCGSGVGTFIMPPITAYLIREMNWRKTLLAEAAIIFSCLSFALLFRPVKPTKLTEIKMEELPKKSDVKIVTTLVNDSLPSNNKDHVIKYLVASNESVDRSHSTIPRMLGVNNNANYPTAVEVFKNPDVFHIVAESRSDSENLNKRYSIPIFQEEEPAVNKDQDCSEKPLLDAAGRPVNIGRRHTMCEKRIEDFLIKPNSSRKGSTHGDATTNRPLYRDDIFFTSSLRKLPQYKSQSSMAYNLSVTRLPTRNDLMEERQKGCKLCPEAFRRALATMLDFSLFRSPTFIVLAISGFLTMMGFLVPFMLVPDRAVKSYGIDEKKALFLISSIGIANTIGRIVSGVLSSMPKMNALVINNVAISIAGIATIASGVYSDLWYQHLYAIVFGLFISCFASLRSVLVTELLGLEKLTNAFGLLLLFQGIGACIGPPLAAKLQTSPNNYEYSFYLAGVLILVSAVMCYPLKYINDWEKRRDQKKQNMQKS